MDPIELALALGPTSTVIGYGSYRVVSYVRGRRGDGGQVDQATGAVSRLRGYLTLAGHVRRAYELGYTTNQLVQSLATRVDDLEASDRERAITPEPEPLGIHLAPGTTRVGPATIVAAQQQMQALVTSQSMTDRLSMSDRSAYQTRLKEEKNHADTCPASYYRDTLRDYTLWKTYHRHQDDGSWRCTVEYFNEYRRAYRRTYYQPDPRHYNITEEVRWENWLDDWTPWRTVADVRGEERKTLAKLLAARPKQYSWRELEWPKGRPNCGRGVCVLWEEHPGECFV